MNTRVKLTATDLDEAKKVFDVSREASVEKGDSHTERLDTIASVCIGIVRELLTCTKPNYADEDRFHRSEVCEDTTYDIVNASGWEVAEKLLNAEDADHFIDLHNLWVRVLSIFGRKD